MASFRTQTPSDAHLHEYRSKLSPPHLLEAVAHLFKGRKYSSFQSADLDGPESKDVLGLFNEVDRVRFSHRSRRVCISITCAGSTANLRDVQHLREVQLFVTFEPIDYLPGAGASMLQPKLETPPPASKKQKADHGDATPKDSDASGSGSGASSSADGSTAGSSGGSAAGLAELPAGGLDPRRVSQ